MKYIKNKIAVGMMTLALLLNSAVPSYAGWKEIKESAKETASKSWKYVKKHKWYFIAGGTALVGGICYSNEQKRKQEEEERRNNPLNDNDNDGYNNGEENREGSDPDDGDSNPQDDAWEELSVKSVSSFKPAYSKLETVVSDKLEISGPIVPVYLNLGKNSSICGEFGKENARLYFNYKF